MFWLLKHLIPCSLHDKWFFDLFLEWPCLLCRFRIMSRWCKLLRHQGFSFGKTYCTGRFGRFFIDREEIICIQGTSNFSDYLIGGTYNWIILISSSIYFYFVNKFKNYKISKLISIMIPEKNKTNMNKSIKLYKVN